MYLTSIYDYSGYVSFQFDITWKKVLSNLSINLAAFWFGVAFVSLAQYTKPFWLLTLTVNIVNGIVCLLTAVRLERDLL